MWSLSGFSDQVLVGETTVLSGLSYLWRDMVVLMTSTLILSPVFEGLAVSSPGLGESGHRALGRVL